MTDNGNSFVQCVPVGIGVDRPEQFFKLKPQTVAFGQKTQEGLRDSKYVLRRLVQHLQYSRHVSTRTWPLGREEK